jgi:glycosyltransferase involved in cell wall biosynthesis
MSARPLVSVVIPAFDRERFLADAIQSVLDQTYQPLEVIVVDDGSRDRSAAVARSFPGVHVIEQKHAGPGAARNRGIAASRGDFLAFLDSDDVMPADKLELQVAYLREHPDVGCVLGREQLLFEPGAPWPAWSGITAELAERRPDIAALGEAPLMTMVVRAWVFERVGGFDDTHLHGDDADWLLRARQCAPVATLDSKVLYRRVHSGNLSNDVKALHSGTFRVLRDHMHRLRAESSSSPSDPA